MGLIIYNSLGREKQDFEPLVQGKVKIYVCGPTVYDQVHIGNFRGAIFFNLVRNWLEYSGFDVSFVYNYTDIDDKIIKRANKEGIDALGLSQKYIDEFNIDFTALKLTQHDYNPKCSDYIEDMVNFVQRLIDKGYAYEVDGSVFYAIERFENYGKLSGRSINDIQVGHRIDPNPNKKSLLDFILWKPSKEGEPFWDSPWGKGRPGWHLECSVMNRCIHGDQIDIHGGGFDLTFPHHDNEIAQSEGLTGKTFAKYWMHHNFINFDDTKMSKSLGNIVKARDFMNEYHPEILKYMMLSVHYRSALNFSKEYIAQAIAGLARVYTALSNADTILDNSIEEGNADMNWEKFLRGSQEKVEEALNDDFSTTVMMATVFDVVRYFNEDCKMGGKITAVLKFKARAFKEWVQKVGLLGSLFQEDAKVFLQTLDGILMKERGLDSDEVERLIEDRKDARMKKDFTRADECRDRLFDMGVILYDTPQKTTWAMKKGF